MVQASNNVRESAAFARRVISRTLTVVGGVAAGTALAWWLTTTAASADVPTPQDNGIAAVQELAAPVTGPVEQAVETAGQYLQDPPTPPADPLTGIGDKVKDAADKFRDQAEQRVEELPACTGQLCLGERQSVDHPAESRSLLPSATVQAPEPVTVTQETSVDPDAIAHRTAKDRAFADGMSRRGSPAPVAPSLPDLPTWPTPFAPTVPSTPAMSGHGSTGNAVDSHLFAALPWQDNDFDLVAGALSASTDSATFGRPGNQPGVAPD